MRIVISKFPGQLKQHPNHPLEKWSCDITNHLIQKNVSDGPSLQLVGVEFDQEEDKFFCSLVLELTDDHVWGPISLVHLIDFVRVSTRRMNLHVEMQVIPVKGIEFSVEI